MAEGRDEVEEPTDDPCEEGPFPSTHYDEDIVWADGFFIRFPLGKKVG